MAAVQTWLQEKSAAQAALAPHEAPVLTADAIRTRMDTVRVSARVCVRCVLF
jgi:hypothetical protein